MLNLNQIKTNKEKFLEKNAEYQIFNEELLNFLGEDLFNAPASTNLDMGFCYPGGLLNLSFKICKYAIQINDLLPEKIRKDKNSIIKVSFLSQIGKTFLFVENKSDWHRKNLGKYYDFNEKMVSMKIGERSVYYAQKHGINLTEEEFQAIVNLDKDPEDKQNKFFSELLTHIIKQARDLATIEEKETMKHNIKILI